MVSFLIQSAFLFLVVLFQISFLNVVFSQASANALLATTIALILSRGFFATWPWIIFLGFLSDVLSMDVVGVTPMVLIAFAYGISFLSRRFLVEHRASGTGLAVLFMIVANIVYIPSIWIVRRMALGEPLSSDGLWTYVSTEGMFAGMLVNSILFLLLYGITLRISHALNFYEDRVVVKR
ncbi:MAG: hypothetical protein PHT88_00010 [Candidatus Moranbacteria bacterium]|nr:hypothetical protein [Candidatus Moranbacteria bacterium]